MRGPLADLQDRVNGALHKTRVPCPRVVPGAAVTTEPQRVKEGNQATVGAETPRDPAVDGVRTLKGGTTGSDAQTFLPWSSLLGQSLPCAGKLAAAPRVSLPGMWVCAEARCRMWRCWSRE